MKINNYIKSVCINISKALDKFMRANCMVSEADAYRWEFNLIENQNVKLPCKIQK